jgi:hypothetical protein
MTRTFGADWLRTNWFVPLLPLLLLAELLIARSNDWSRPGLLEHAIIFDLCLFVPALYAACYYRSQTVRALALRAIGLACVGLFIASRLVPAEAQTILPHLGWARTIGLAVIGLVELKLLFEIIKMTFGARTSAEALAEKTGVPTWVAQLMVLEARFWAAVWRFFRRS